MKKVLMIGTGGTIASMPSDDGLVPALTGKELIEAVPELRDICDIDCTQVMNMDSTNIRPGHWLTIAETVRKNYDSYDGFVIAHGTDTMAYTAAGLSYLIQNSVKPVVCTGAQIPLAERNTDAARNLIDAFLYACDDKSHGVQIVFSGSVILGTRARKNYTKRFDAFGSVNYPEKARIQSGKILHFFDDNVSGEPIFYDYLNPNIGLLKLTPGMRKDVLRYLLDTYEGLVIESFGVGGLPEYSDFYGEITRAIGKGKTVVMTTQVPNEGSDIAVYHVGNKLKKSTGVLEAHDMTTEAALTKLMWVMGQTNDTEKIKQMFMTPVSKDMLLGE